MSEPDQLAELRALYPALSDAELAEIEETIDRYLAIVVRVAQRGSDSSFDNDAPATLR